MAKRTKRQQKSSAQLKEFRKLYTKAKRAGLVKDKGPSKDFVPTKYMRGRLKKLSPYLGPEYQVVKASPELAKVWRNAPSEIVPKTFNRRLVVRKAPGVSISTKGGILALRQKLAAGTFEELPLPMNVRSIRDLREWIQTNRYYNDILKHRDEFFNFKIFGNPSYNNFGDLESLIEELEKYQSFEEDDWEDNEEFFSQFSLFRSYKDWKWERDTPDYKARAYAARKAKREAWLRANRPDAWEAKQKRRSYNRSIARRSQPGYAAELEARKAKRKSETPEQREARLARERARDRARRGKGDE